jgi:hypothetical protein
MVAAGAAVGAAFIAAWIGRRQVAVAAKLGTSQISLGEEQANIAREQAAIAREQAGSARDQASIARFSSGVQIAFEHRRYMTSEPFRKTRQAAARYILAIKDSGSEADVRALLSEFELLGLLLRRQTLDEEVVWSWFSTRVLHYHPSLREFIQEERKGNSTYWIEFDSLHDAMCRIEKQKLGNDENPSPNAVRAFLKREAALVDPLPSGIP